MAIPSTYYRAKVPPLVHIVNGSAQTITFHQNTTQNVLGTQHMAD